jgi:hypothetical protein
MVLALKIGTPTYTGTQLRGSERIRAVIGFETGDPAILYSCYEQAATTAVMRRAAYANLLHRRIIGKHIFSVLESSGEEK